MKIREFQNVLLVLMVILVTMSMGCPSGPNIIEITAIGEITGGAEIGDELTSGALTPAGATVSYQWRICDTEGGAYADIPGETTGTYTLVAGDETKYIKVVATGTGSYSGTATSAAFGPVLLSIGASYGGGVVAYIFQIGDTGYVASEQHGLIAATADHASTVVWSNRDADEIGTTGTAIGTGVANTSAIIGQANHTNSAAKVCEDYSAGDFEDWYLPSKDELNTLYQNRVAIGGFATTEYWSSSEDLVLFSWYQNFSDGTQSSRRKFYAYKVRPVRSF